VKLCSPGTDTFLQDADAYSISMMAKSFDMKFGQGSSAGEEEPKLGSL